MHYLLSGKKKLRVPWSTHKVASKNSKKNITIILLKRFSDLTTKTARLDLY